MLLDMHPIVKKERELSAYLEEWVTARYSIWNDFYRATSQDRRTGIYLLDSGHKLLDLLNDIMGNIEEHFAIEKGCHLIPSCFSSIPQLLQFLENFNNHIKRNYHLIERNLKGEETNMIVLEMYRMCNDIDQMVTRCQSIYLCEEYIPIPYQQAKSALRNNDVGTFVEMMQSLVASVPYNVHKEHLDEGYFHTIIHVITSILGMSPISEMETSDGRIDMEIEFPNRVYVIEFKYSGDDKDRSLEALDQIKEKEYAKSLYMKGKIIEGIGMSFSQKSHNIDTYTQERLYTPQTALYNYSKRETK